MMSLSKTWGSALLGLLWVLAYFVNAYPPTQGLAPVEKDVYYIVIILPDLEHSRYPWMFGLQRVKPAIDIALEKIVNFTHLTSGFELVLRTADSKCDTSYPINEAFNFYMRHECTVFFGPCCDYSAAPIARQIYFWNIPMVTTGAMASDFQEKADKYPYLTRVGPTINSLITPLITLMKQYNWTKFKQVYEPNGQNAIYRLCHFTADGLHLYLQMHPEENITESHVKLTSHHNYEELLMKDIGNGHAGEASH